MSSNVRSSADVLTARRTADWLRQNGAVLLLRASDIRNLLSRFRVLLEVEIPRLQPWGTVKFSIYGVVKKRVKVEPIVSMTAESALMTVPAIGFLILLASRGEGDFAQLGIGYDLLLACSGVVTAVPLLLFAYAAQRIPLSVLGLTQYLAPTLQFLLGVFYFREAMSTGRWVGFALVWIALMVISVQAVATARRSRRVAVTEPT